MKVFTVHEPPDTGNDTVDRIAFVKEGFCWPALFVPMFWLLWHRMWWVLLAWMAIGAALGVGGELIDWLTFPAGVLSVVFALWFALEANGLRRWSLARKGWRMLDVAAGRDREEAEQSFFRRHGDTAPRRAASSVPSRGGPAVRRPAPQADEAPIGLFPQPD